jgi:hypothetical protein
MSIAACLSNFANGTSDLDLRETQPNLAVAFKGGDMAISTKSGATARTVKTTVCVFLATSSKLAISSQRS